jgi:hypothetical protein
MIYLYFNLFLYFKKMNLSFSKFLNFSSPKYLSGTAPFRPIVLPSRMSPQRHVDLIRSRRDLKALAKLSSPKREGLPLTDDKHSLNRSLSEGTFNSSDTRFISAVDTNSYMDTEVAH